MQNIEYRIANITDYKKLLDLRLGLVREYDDIESMNKEEFSKEFKKFLEDEIGKNYTIFVATKGNEIISNIYLGIINRIPSPIKDGKSIGYITNVYTKKEYRNKGIGAKLMDFVIDYAKKEDCEVLFVWPSEGAITYYHRAGFSGENAIMERGLR